MNKLIALLFLLAFAFLLLDTGIVKAEPVLQVEWYTNEDVFYSGDPSPQPNTEALRNAVLDVINGATTSIDIALYGLSEQSIVDALVNAHLDRVTVRVVGHGEYYTHSVYGDFYRQLQDAGIDLVLSDGLGLMHNKFIVADGRTVLTGSTNFTTTGLFYNFNNIMVFPNDVNIASAYTCKFNEMFVDRRFGRNATSSCGGTFYYDGGVSVEVIFTPNQGTYYVNELVNNVMQSDEIYGNWFYMTLDEAGNAMSEAIANGATLHAVMDANGFSGTGSEGRLLCDSGANIRVENVGGKMHEKAMLFVQNDGAKVIWTGSANFSRAASVGSSTYGANDENTVIIRGYDSIFDQYIEYFWRLFNELPPHQYCRTTNAENNISACRDAHDNDHDGYFDENDFNCDEATLETCQDGIDNDGDGYKDSDDFGCWLINKLCPPSPPFWLPPEVEQDLLILRWSAFSGEGLTPLYQLYGSRDGKEWTQVLATTYTDWQVPKEFEYRFIRLGGDGCLDIPQGQILEIEYPYVVGSR